MKNLPRRWEIAGPEIADFLDHVECELKGSNSTETHHHEDNPCCNAMFVKESSVVLSRLLHINPFLRGTFGMIGTSFKYDESVQEFMRAVP